MTGRSLTCQVEKQRCAIRKSSEYWRNAQSIIWESQFANASTKNVSKNLFFYLVSCKKILSMYPTNNSDKMIRRKMWFVEDDYVGGGGIEQFRFAFGSSGFRSDEIAAQRVPFSHLEIGFSLRSSPKRRQWLTKRNCGPAKPESRLPHFATNGKLEKRLLLRLKVWKATAHLWLRGWIWLLIWYL